MLIGALVLILTQTPSVPADPFPLDPVADLRKVLDPDSRKTITEEQIENLRTLGDLGEAMLIINQARDRITQDLRMRLAERFEKAARSALGKPESRSVTVNFLHDLALTERSSTTTHNVFLRSSLATLAPDIAKLANDIEPRVRQTAVRTLGNLEFDPQIILPPIERLLLNGNSTEDRRAGADALGSLVRTPITNDFQDEVKGLEKGKVIVPVGNDEETNARLLGQSLAIYSPLPKTTYLGRIQIVAIRELEMGKEGVGQLIGEPVEAIKPGDRLSAKVDFNNDVISIASKKILAKDKERDVAIRRLTINAVEFTTNGTLILMREENEQELGNQLPLFEVVRDNAKALAVAAEDPDDKVRLTALRALEDMGLMRERLRYQRPGVAPEADAVLHAALKEVLPALTRAVSDSNPQARIKAVETLERIADILGQGASQSEEAVRALVKALRDPENTFVRWSAARTLGKVAPGFPDLVLPGLTRGLSDPDIGARLAMIIAINNYGETQVQATTPAKPETIRAAVVALGRITGQGYPYVVVNGVYHGDSNVRLSAVRALDAIGTGAAPAIPDLMLALDDGNPDVRQNVANVLGHFGKEGALARPALQRTLNDPDPEVRRAAAAALLRIGNP
jgi:HEAT repeat protein